MPHSKNKLMSIGEVAKALNITRKIILNYEAKGLIFPDKKDGSTGNRYYSADSLVRMRTIRLLQNLGLSLDDIGHYYKGTTNLTPLIQRMEKLRDELTLNIEKLKERSRTDKAFEIRTIKLPAQTIYRKTMETATIAEKITILRETFLEAMKFHGLDTSSRMVFIEYPRENPNLASYCITIPPTSEGDHVVHLPEATALCVFHHGSYESLHVTRKNFLAYVQENNIKAKGPFRETYLEGPPHHTDPSKFITQISVVIE